MQRSRPFQRFHVLMAAVGALLSAANSPAGMAAGRSMTRAQAISELGGYRSKSKTGSRSHDNGGTRAFQRLAAKKRNRKAHRRACRG